MLTISTAWNYKPDLNIYSWLSEVKALGFDGIELDYQLSRQHLEELSVYLKELNLVVSSVHNFCPTPNDGPSLRHISNYYRLSSLSEIERLKAVEWTKNTIDTAFKFKARAVVVHAGTVESDDDRSVSFFELYKSGKRQTDEFVEKRNEILRMREDKKGPYIDELGKSV